MGLSGNTCLIPNEVMAKHLMRLEGMADILFRMSSGEVAPTDAELMFIADSLKASAEVLMAYSMTDAIPEP